MWPIELLWTAAGFAEHAEDLSIQGQLVEPAGLLIDGEEILRRAIGRDAKRPGSTRIRRVWIGVAQCRMPFFVVRHIEPDELLEVAIGIEHLDASISPIGDVHVSLSVDLHVMRIPKLARAGPI